MKPMDPVAELVRDLTEHGQPSLAWTVKWGASGCPLISAWQASRDPMAMFDLLKGWTDSERWFSEVDYQSNDLPVQNTSGLVGYVKGDPSALVTLREGKSIQLRRWDPDAADALRRAIPSPGSLTDILSTRRPR